MTEEVQTSHPFSGRASQEEEFNKLWATQPHLSPWKDYEANPVKTNKQRSKQMTDIA